MAPGWSLSDLTFSRYSTAVNNLVIEINSANRITLQGQAAFAYAAVETLQFSGGPTISFYDIRFTTHGTESNNTLNGISYGASLNDIIYGYGGNDTLYGWDGNDTLYGGDGNDTLHGGNGNDLYVFDGGLDTIWESSGTDTLWITNGVTINDISIVNHSSANIKVIVDSGVDEVIISNFRSTSSGYKVEYITFDDGFTADLLTHASWTWGTGGGDTMTGTSGANTLIGLDGNDTIDGAGGNDSIHGGAGDDVLYGGDGNDLLHGGVGDDVLYGGAGTDTLYGGAGADTFVFEEASAFSNVDVIADFSIVQGDVIDLSDLLGLYDPLNDAISDFVVMTEGGGNSMVFVDRDGLGGMYGLEQVATVQGVTGLSDVDTLVAQNVLVVV
jgi:Ca2+-binding RTX toxin-like protein